MCKVGRACIWVQNLILVPHPSPNFPPIVNHDTPYCMLRRGGGVEGEPLKPTLKLGGFMVFLMTHRKGTISILPKLEEKWNVEFHFSTFHPKIWWIYGVFDDPQKKHNFHFCQNWKKSGSAAAIPERMFA